MGAGMITGIVLLGGSIVVLLGLVALHHQKKSKDVELSTDVELSNSVEQSKNVEATI